MDALTPINLLVAFAAGTLSFLSPCMLPLVPGYLAWMGAPPSSGRPARQVRSALLFVAGFSIVFVVLGMGAGLLGGAAGSSRRPIEMVGGTLIAIMGALILLEHRLPARMQSRIGRNIRPGEPTASGALGFGVVFGAAWSPCIGPTLGAILALAAAGQQPVIGALLLAVFALGLGLPFLLLAFGVERIERLVVIGRAYARPIRLASGALLLLFGLLVALGVIGQLSSRLAGIPGIAI